jgi:ribonuclease HI
MVTRSQILGILAEYVDLYEGILSTSNNRGDLEAARYGLQEAKEMIDLVRVNDETLNRRTLNQLNGQLMNLSRGVEGFEDYESQSKKRELGTRLYFIQEDILVQLKPR